MSFALVLSAIIVAIIIHEFGHYLAARSFGVSVKQFCIGFGPKLISFADPNGTEWKLKLLPIGGFIEMGSEHSRIHPLKKIAISFAGPLANILTACVIVYFFSGSLFQNFVMALPSIYMEYIKTLFEVVTFSNIENVKLLQILGGGHSVDVFTYFMTISVGLGLFNLAPIPPLDGGHILISTIEMIFGKDTASRIHLMLYPVGIISISILVFRLYFGGIF